MKVERDESLLPCPFCGSEAEHVIDSAGNDFVRCSNKYCAARTRLYNENYNGARMNWNRRVDGFRE